MASTQVEISKIEIDPNRLRSYSKVPLPDFAIERLNKNGFNYPSKQPHNGGAEHDLQSTDKQLKLALHIQSIKSHIDKDGPRIYNGGSGGDEWNERNRQFAESSSDAN
jgi:hypothetical protein